MKTLTATYQRGFTLLEIVLVMSVLGVLATVGLQTYSYQVAKARVVDAVVLMEGVRTDVLVDFISRSRFPGKIQEALASTEAGASQVHDSGNAVISQGKGAVDKYWYYGNDMQGIGWFAVELSPRVLPGCDSDCQLHLGFRKHNNRLEFHCGLWDGGNFPAEMLPTGCKETCVSCRLSTSDSGEDALTAALNNPIVPPTPAGGSGTATGNNSGGSNNPVGGSNPDNHNSDPGSDQDTDGPGESEDNGSSSAPGNAEGSSPTESGDGSDNDLGNAYTAPGAGSNNSDDSNSANTGAQNGNHDDADHGSSGSGNGGNGGGGSAGLPLTPNEGDHAESDSEESRDDDSTRDDEDDCEESNNGRGNSNAGRGNNNAGGNDCKNPNAGPGNNSGNGNTDPGRGKGKGRRWS